MRNDLNRAFMEVEPDLYLAGKSSLGNALAGYEAFEARKASQISIRNVALVLRVKDRSVFRILKRT